MIESIKKYRDILGFVALGAAGLMIVMNLITVSSWAKRTAHLLSGIQESVPMWMYFVLLAVVVLCIGVKPVSEHASMIALGAMIIGALGIVATIVGGIAQMTAPTSNGLVSLAVLVGVLVLAILKAAILFIIHLFRKTVAPATAQTPALNHNGPNQTAGSQLQGIGQQQGTAQQQPGQRPTWQADQASGGAWTRAGDAASGASASSWGVPGTDSRSWQPQNPAAHNPGQQNPAGQNPGQHPWNPSGQWGNQQSRQNLPYSGESPEDGTILRPRDPR